MKRFISAITLFMAVATCALAESVTFDFTTNSYGVTRKADSGTPTTKAKSLQMNEGDVNISFTGAGQNSYIGFNQDGLYIGSSTDFLGLFAISATDANITGLQIVKGGSGDFRVRIDEEIFAEDGSFYWSGSEKVVEMNVADSSSNSSALGKKLGIISHLIVEYEPIVEEEPTVPEIPDYSDVEVPEMPETLVVTSNDPDAEIIVNHRIIDDSMYPSHFYYIHIASSCNELTATVDIPEGWDEMYYCLGPEIDGANDNTIYYRSANWEDAAEIEKYGFTKGNVFKVYKSLYPVSYEVVFAKDGLVDINSLSGLDFEIVDGTGVEAVEAAEDEEAVYYTLGGIRVASPQKGVPYIRVKGGVLIDSFNRRF